FYVKEQIEVLYVIVVQPQTFFFGHGPSSPLFYLPQTGDSRRTQKSQCVLVGGDFFGFIEWQWSVTDQGHVPDQHIPELWQFINAGIPDKFSYPCHPGIVHDFDKSGFFLCLSFCSIEFLAVDVPVVIEWVQATASCLFAQFAQFFYLR